jgi:guanylate kinase
MTLVFTISETFRPGESSVADRVCELLDGLELAIPYTTRPPRSADDDGFIFMSREVFERLIASDEFLEFVDVLGNYYGTPRHHLQKARDNGNDLLIKVDEHGTEQIREKLPDAVSILVLYGPPVPHEHTTGSTVDEHLLYRLYEASSSRRKLNPDRYDHVIADSRLEKAAEKVTEIIRSERLGRS